MTIVERAKQAIRGRGLALVLPEGEDERIVAAAHRLLAEGLAEPILIGATETAAGTVISPTTDSRKGEYAQRIAGQREGMTSAMAERLLRRPLYFAATMAPPTPWSPAPPTRPPGSSRRG